MQASPLQHLCQTKTKNHEQLTLLPGSDSPDRMGSWLLCLSRRKHHSRAAGHCANRGYTQNNSRKKGAIRASIQIHYQTETIN